MENDVSSSSIVLCAVIAAVRLLPSRCLATIGDIHIDRLTTGIYEVRRRDGFRCHDIHTEFHKERFNISKVDIGGDTQTYRQHGDLISVLSFLKIRKVGYKLDSKT
jgi:hypothetical protein